jgi:hypothetical protein
MRPPFPSTDFQESRIEEEPVLGTVLRLPDGTIRSLTWWERTLVWLRLVDAAGLADRTAKAARA